VRAKSGFHINTIAFVQFGKSMTAAALSHTSLPEFELLKRGKVRDVYTVDADHLLIVATDRISAFDCILPTPIARKGEVLTSLSRFWFEKLRDIVPNHFITTDFARLPAPVQRAADFEKRSMLVTKAEVFPVECVVRGYLVGSGWKDYLRETSIRLYNEAREYARQRGIIIADTKFEFGRDKDGKILLVDEALTPDSSRFWPAETYIPGRSQPSFDKQFVRDYLETVGWDKKPPAPELPTEVAASTTERYLEAYRLLTGKEL